MIKVPRSAQNIEIARTTKLRKILESIFNDFILIKQRIAIRKPAHGLKLYAGDDVDREQHQHQHQHGVIIYYFSLSSERNAINFIITMKLSDASPDLPSAYSGHVSRKTLSL